VLTPATNAYFPFPLLEYVQGERDVPEELEPKLGFETTFTPQVAALVAVEAMVVVVVVDTV
jgi:hypothetical protein